MLAEEQQLVVMLQRDDTLQGSKQVPCSGRSFQKWFEHHPMIQRSPELKLVLKKENRRTRAKKFFRGGSRENLKGLSVRGGTLRWVQSQ